MILVADEEDFTAMALRERGKAEAATAYRWHCNMKTFVKSYTLPVLFNFIHPDCLILFYSLPLLFNFIHHRYRRLCTHHWRFFVHSWAHNDTLYFLPIWGIERLEKVFVRIVIVKLMKVPFRQQWSQSNHNGESQLISDCKCHRRTHTSVPEVWTDKRFQNMDHLAVVEKNPKDDSLSGVLLLLWHCDLLSRGRGAIILFPLKMKSGGGLGGR